MGIWEKRIGLLERMGKFKEDNKMPQLKSEITRKDRVDIIYGVHTIAHYYPISNKLTMDLYEGDNRREQIISYVTKQFQVPRSQLFITTSR